MSAPEPLREDPGKAPVSSLEEARKQRQLGELARAHRDFLRGLAAKLCRSHFDPDDLVQDVLERAIQHFDRLPPDTNHRAWMARVMQNLFIDKIRRRDAAPGTTPIDDVPVATPPPEDVAWWENLDADDVRARVAELPVELRDAFALFAFEGCSYQEISARLDIPKATVGTRILRARRRLKELLTRAAGEEK